MGCQASDQGGNKSPRYFRGHHWGQRDSSQPPCGPVHYDEVYETMVSYTRSMLMWLNLLAGMENYAKWALVWRFNLAHWQTMQKSAKALTDFLRSCQTKPPPVFEKVVCLGEKGYIQPHKFPVGMRGRGWPVKMSHSSVVLAPSKAMSSNCSPVTAVLKACTSWRPARPDGLLPCGCSQSLSGRPLQETRRGSMWRVHDGAHFHQ